MNLFKHYFKKGTKNINEDFYSCAKLEIEMTIDSSIDACKILLKEKNWNQILFSNKNLSSGLLRLHMLERRSGTKLDSEKEFGNNELILDSIFNIIHQTEVSITDVYYQLNLWILHNRFDKIDKFLKTVDLIKPTKYSKQNLYEIHYMNFLNLLKGDAGKIDSFNDKKKSKDPIANYYSHFSELYCSIINRNKIEDKINIIEEEFNRLQQNLTQDSSLIYGGSKDSEFVTNFTLDVALKVYNRLNKYK